jgi:hypothetical protein
MRSSRTLHRWLLASLLPAWILAAGPARAQDDGGRLSNATKVDNAVETREYRERLRDGGPFDEAAREFVVGTAVPQLALEANRSTVERVRRRIPEWVLPGDMTDKAFADAATTLVEAAASLARSGTTAAVVRVNAMLLLGDLRDKDKRRLLPAAVPALAAAAGDATLPLEVRVAAAAGLARHADASKAAGDTAGLAKAVTPALAPMLTGGPASKPGSAAAIDWLAGRALAILQALGPQAGTQAAVQSAARILDDAARAIDLRVRAAAALGSAATAESGVDAGRAVEAVRAAATAALEADIAALESRRFESQLAGGGPPSGGGDVKASLPVLACRRNAWRLATCAEALVGPDGGSGLARLLGNDAATAKTLAAALKQAATALDSQPEERSVRDALAALGRPSGAAGPGDAGPSTTEPSRPQPPAGEPESPFASPFAPQPSQPNGPPGGEPPPPVESPFK